MTSIATLPKPDLVLTSGGPLRSTVVEPEIAAPKLTVYGNGRPIHRDTPSSFANLSGVFRQMAELQQQFAEQVVGMEGALGQHQERIEGAITDLPELKGRVNWLISTYYEQSQVNESVKTQLTEVAGDVSEVRHASARQDGQMELAQRDLAAIGRSVSERLEGFTARLEAQEQRTGTSPAALNGLSEQIEALAAGLAEQKSSLAALTETVRGLGEAQQQWKSAMGQLTEALGKWSL